ncbi:hypothetical protein PIB30_118492 [Stylosanthes scabra]|uniref:hAT-like transposase RNase-H fold domain-containing protein n=1 Tax=Stylosanthes scabra TaxID=79078 RepID=A0ABU6SLJ5_9FABA|nr:hypothetical protein [Stylosanthes scabra]
MDHLDIVRHMKNGALQKKKICEFLEPFYETTNLISGSSYPTSNLYFMQVWKIQSLLEKSQTSDVPVIMNMALRMKVKFDKYWKDYSIVLAFGAILDPRLKLKFLKFCYQKLDPSTSDVKTDEVLEKFKRLYEEYRNTFSGSTASQCRNQSPKSPEEGRLAKKRKMVLKEFREFDSETQTSTEKNELEIYLKEGLIHTNKDDLKYNVLHFLED